MKMKKLVALVCSLAMIIGMMSSTAYAVNTQSEYNNAAILVPMVDGTIDDKVYSMVEGYRAGNFIERNDDPTMNPRQLFANMNNNLVSASENTNIKASCIYDIEQVDDTTFEATSVMLYSDLSQMTQDEADGVILFTTIVYEKASFDLKSGPSPVAMLKKIKGGVVQNNGKYWCEFLYMRYSVHGDAYDATGKRVGPMGDETDYGGAVISPQVGTTYYIDGPCDYYYDTNVFNTVLVGFTKGTISYRLSSYRNELIVASAIQGF